MPYLIPATGMFFALLYTICMRVRADSLLYRLIARAAPAACMLLCYSLLPFAGVGVNAVTLYCVSALGLPGLALMQVIALIP